MYSSILSSDAYRRGLLSDGYILLTGLDTLSLERLILKLSLSALPCITGREANCNGLNVKQRALVERGEEVGNPDQRGRGIVIPFPKKDRS